MEWFEDDSDTKLLLLLQFTETFAALPLSNLILHLWKIKHDALQPVVMDERESITWTTQQKSHPDSGDKNLFPLTVMLSLQAPATMHAAFSYYLT